VRKMEGDGNCLFRAFADQMIGDCEEHQQFRDECCDTMEENSEVFELFHADDDEEENLSFYSYVQRMRHPGRWGSQLELMALCQRHNVNAIVHQSGRPAYEMGNAARDARCIQLSYHDGEHYNSIRFAFDLSPGQPAQHLSLVQLKGSGDESEESEDVQQVRELLPPEHPVCVTAIRAALARAQRDASVAAEFLLMEQYGTDEVLEPSRGADENPAETARTKGSASSARQKRADKRQGKEAGEQKHKAGPSAGETDENMALLGKQLLSV
jgi:hypothetical protein